MHPQLFVGRKPEFLPNLREALALAVVVAKNVDEIILPQPAVEIGWRLGPASQGRGLATEGARAVVDFAFHTIGLVDVVAITVPPNVASRRVMEKLAMTYRPELTFDHPTVGPDFPHKHIVYSLANPCSGQTESSIGRGSAA